MERPRISQSRRRLHLDFHNPAGIPGFCARFRPEVFARTIRDAGFDAVTVFGLDSHGYAYFPSRCAPVHPDLQRDLLGEMVAACQAEGLAVAAYLAVGCSDFADSACWQVRPDGQPYAGPDAPGYRAVCLNSPYVDDVVLPAAREVATQYPVDALFFDLLHFFDTGCHCRWCQGKSKEWGIPGDTALDRRRLTRRTVDAFAEKAARLLRPLRPGMELTYNTMSIHERPGALASTEYFDIEAPATGGWGYFYFPPRVRYVRGWGLPVSGMTVAFHASWGGFGSLKSRAMLEFECYGFLTGGAGVGIGDQLPPSGELEPARYARIGEVLRPLRALDPILAGAKPHAEAAILLPPLGAGQFPSAPWASATKLLLEEKIQFDVVDRQSDWSPYPLLILPDDAYTDARTCAKLREYIAAGRAVLATGNALAALPDPCRPAPAGPCEAPAYLCAAPAVFPELPAIPHVLQCGAQPLTAPHAQVLATLGRAIGQTAGHYYFSAQPPCAGDTGLPIAVQNGKIIAISVPLFSEYWQSGYGVWRQFFSTCLARLLPERLVRTNAPLAWEVAVLAQDERRIAIVVPYAALRTGQVPDQLPAVTPQVDDWLPMADLEVGIRGDYRRAWCPLAPDIKPEMRVADGFTVARLAVARGPQVLVFE